jgi:hypothetical protein
MRLPAGGTLSISIKSLDIAERRVSTRIYHSHRVFPQNPLRVNLGRYPEGGRPWFDQWSEGLGNKTVPYYGWRVFSRRCPQPSLKLHAGKAAAGPPVRLQAIRARGPMEIWSSTTERHSKGQTLILPVWPHWSSQKGRLKEI